MVYIGSGVRRGPFIHLDKSTVDEKVSMAIQKARSNNRHIMFKIIYMKNIKAARHSEAMLLRYYRKQQHFLSIAGITIPGAECVLGMEFLTTVNFNNRGAQDRTWTGWTMTMSHTKHQICPPTKFWVLFEKGSETVFPFYSGKRRLIIHEHCIQLIFFADRTLDTDIQYKDVVDCWPPLEKPVLTNCPCFYQSI